MAGRTAMTTSINTLELRSVTIPLGPMRGCLEHAAGKPFAVEARHYLSGQPVSCGTILELFQSGTWVIGRYEWTGNPGDAPTFHLGEQVVRLDEDLPLRWPKGEENPSL